MHTITFYPLGNADTCLIELASGAKLLFDYAATRDPKDDKDLRADLPSLLGRKLQAAKKETLDVVAFTHADNDHTCGASDFFHLLHASKYQTEGRVGIDELWVPAAMILDTEDEMADDARVLRDEARYRLTKLGKGIRVFSRPAALEEWLKQQSIKLADVQHLISDAGTTVPGYAAATEGVEFFVHSPFAVHKADELEDRNSCSIILQARFEVDGEQTNLFLCGDTEHEALADIIRITNAKERQDRLDWDIYDIPHHCSYAALSAEKGDSKTVPTEEIRSLLEDHAGRGAILVSCSDVIPSKNTKQPPHRQAYAYYDDVKKAAEGELYVTMQHPKSTKPEPLVIKIKRSGAIAEKAIMGATHIASTTNPPRAGHSSVQ